MQIYLDNSATTKPRTEAIAAAQTVLQRQWGNPSSLHRLGTAIGNSFRNSQDAGSRFTQCSKS